MKSSCHLLDEGTWQSQPSMKIKRSFAAASVTESGKMIVTGGRNENGYLLSTEIFASGQWEDGPNLPVKMHRHCQVTSNAGVIVAGEIIEINHFDLHCVLF